MAFLALLASIVIASLFVVTIGKFASIHEITDHKELPGPSNTLGEYKYGRKPSAFLADDTAGLKSIGRIHDLPRKHTWIQLRKWGDKYGPVYQSSILGKLHIWIMTDDLARDILNKRGHIYSERPAVPNIADTKTSGEYFALMDCNDSRKRQKRFAHIVLQRDNQTGYQDYLDGDVRRLLVKLLEDHSDYGRCIEQFTARMACRLAWGDPDHSAELAYNSTALLKSVSLSGRVTNILPQLMLLPEAINPWKKEESIRHSKEAELLMKWQAQVRTKMSESHARPSWTRTYFESKEDFGLDDKEAAYAVGMLALASVLTIGSALETFVYSMTHHPGWLEFVHREVDAVCGDRMPELADYAKLSTLRACIKEGMRWRPPLPMGIPHELLQDDVWNGYHLPNGCSVHAVEWVISREPAKYPEPDTFMPDRWLDAKYPTYREPLSQFPTLTGHHLFGYGRRVCQGIASTEAHLLVACGAIVWGLNLKRLEGDLSTPHEFDYTPSFLIAKPHGFVVDAKARAQSREELIFANWDSVQVQDPQLISQSEAATPVEDSEWPFRPQILRMIRTCDSYFRA